MSQFRDSAGAQIALYREQIQQLDYPPELLRLYLCESDSVDDTLAELQAWAVEDERLTILTATTGLPRFFHTPRPERIKAITVNFNRGFERAASDAWGDFALMLESDLLYQPDLLRRLVSRIPPQASIFAPLVWIDVDGLLRFYDVWAYRLEGRMIEAYTPAYFFQRFGTEPFELDSVGSVVLFKMDVIQAGIRLSETEAIVGACRQAKAAGYRIFCDPDTHILHPKVAGVV